MGRSWAPASSSPPLHSLFLGRPGQGTQCNRSSSACMRASNEGVGKGRKLMTQDTGSRRETCECRGGWRRGEAGSEGGDGLTVTFQAPFTPEHGTWGLGTKSMCQGTPKALFVHSFTLSLLQEHVLSTFSCAPGAGSW